MPRKLGAVIELLGDTFASALHWVGPFVIGSSATAAALAVSRRVSHRIEHRAVRS